MTEFGLEIISTVETEDGQPVEFSTSTSDKNLKKDSAGNQPSEENCPEDEGICCCISLSLGIGGGYSREGEGIN